jgi:hypothetical protein
MTAFIKRKAELKLSLSKANSKIHFSFDLWTSPNHLALLGIVAYYIDQYSQNQLVSLALVVFSPKSAD